MSLRGAKQYLILLAGLASEWKKTHPRAKSRSLVDPYTEL